MSTQTDQNQGGDKVQDKGSEKRRNRGGRRNRNRQEARGPKPEVMQLAFVERTHGDEKKYVSFIDLGNGDTAIVYLKTMRFVPKVGAVLQQGALVQRTYECLVWRKNGANGVYFLAEPTEQQMSKLTPEEWLPIEEFANLRIVKLTFSMQFSRFYGREVPMTRHQGRIVFLSEGSEVKLGKQAMYLLHEHGSVARADYIPVAEGSSSSGTALARIMVEQGEAPIADLERIVVKTATPNRAAMAKDGVRTPTDAKHLTVTAGYQSIYDILSDVTITPPVIITGASTAKQIRKAALRKKAAHSADATNGYYRKTTGNDAPFAALYEADLFMQAVIKAEAQALAILEIVEAGGEVVELPNEELVSEDLLLLTATAEGIEPDAFVELHENVQLHLRAKLAKEAAGLANISFDEFTMLKLDESMQWYRLASSARVTARDSRRRR